ncbi:MAG: hypothetical protein AAGC97_19185 [Planctomycetota bacterium]
MESIGFVFGITGLSFGLLGFVFGISASNAAALATGKLSELEERLVKAGVLEREPHQ